MRTLFATLISAILMCTVFAGPAEPSNSIDKSIVKTEYDRLVPQLKSYYTAQQLQEGVYVGGEFCIACHSQERPWLAGWRDSKHAQALRRPMAQWSLVPGKGVVADYDQNGVDDFMDGLDFNTINSAFDKYKPNAPILSYDEGNYYITIGDLTMQVVVTQGGTGDWKQRYLLRVPVSGTATGLSEGNYVSPVQFNEKTHGYVIYHGDDWYDSANQPKFGSGTSAADLAANNTRQYSKKCIGCHTTGFRDLYEDNNGEWIYKPFPAVLHEADDPTYVDYDQDGILDIVNISCEACHGPGSAHILAAGDPEQIVNPHDLTTKQNNDICAQCHVRTKSVPNGVHDFPIDDNSYTRWMPGSEEPLENYYTDAAGYWPDGYNSKQHHQQAFDLDKSGKPAFAFHQVRCTECHYAHSSPQKHQVRRSIREEMDDGTTLTIPTQNDNNTLCLACHATHGDFEEITKEQVAEYEANKSHIGEVVSAHTNHPYAPERSMGLSRCSKCHMPKIAKSAINYDIHSHTFDPISPEKTLEYQAEGGMPNACATSCHGSKVDSFNMGLDAAPSTWNEQFDVDLATELLKYYGPEGLWWSGHE